MKIGIHKASNHFYWFPRQLTLKQPDRPAIFKWGRFWFMFSDKNQIIKKGVKRLVG
jgi:hypothetical protein